jgi:hypothetical protein
MGHLWERSGLACKRKPFYHMQSFCGVSGATFASGGGHRGRLRGGGIADREVDHRERAVGGAKAQAVPASGHRRGGRTGATARRVDDDA